ncbi:hypothetical protein [Kibdelosporangium aridum]|uniref:hypothetical protein n=1 Tax=Kibdelosporangium aridum TaxID=2030 RepID=UPI0005274C67
MDMTSWLLRRMAVRPFIVAAPGATAARLAAERCFRERRWRTAVNPVEANMLVVAGDVDVGRIWEQMPLPKTKVDLTPGIEVHLVVDAAVEKLRDRHSQHPAPEAAHEMTGHKHHEPDTAAHDMGQHDHDSHGMGGHSHGGHDMGEMVLPGGIPMASRIEDRDGLALDYLHVFLGPVLADWPPGLVVKATMQGDILQEVEVEVIGRPGGYWTEDRMPARRLDSCGRLLAVAGWETAAAKARELRDQVLSGQNLGTDYHRWARRVRRSKVLRWSLAGVGEWQGLDAWGRLTGWLDQVDLDQGMTALPGLLNGSELANARLIVASLDPDTDHD